MRDEYSRCAFVLDAGTDVEQLASTVIDLSVGDVPKVLRVGAGDASIWAEDGDVHVEVDDPDLAWGFA
jgi:tRNA A37 threonylcarbamoyladenosine synthetase subunit TsaC/SUA5/YrdC